MNAIEWLAQLGRRILMLLRRKQFDADLAEEMRLHRELREQEQIERGLSPKEARYAAQRRFGNDLVLREESRDMWGWNWLENTVQDVRYGLRQLRRSPGFTAVAVLTLALGIGANTAIFSVVNAVLLRPLPFKDPSRLVRVEERHEGWPETEFTYATFLDLQDRARSLQDVAAYRDWNFNLVDGGEPEQVAGAMVSASFFPALGVSPWLGRVFTADEDRPGSDNVVVLSYARSGSGGLGMTRVRWGNR